MVKCPNPNCESTEFSVEGIKVEGQPTTLYVLVCKQCNRIITTATKGIEGLIRTIKH
jgi:Fe2+ or Zn2+ uptake regulation protein